MKAARPTWDDYFMRLAALAATRSTCPRRQVGAVLVRNARVVATGYNGSLRGQPHCLDVGCLMVGGHCKRTVHAEINALLQCARYGVSSDGAAIYTTCFPCWDCAQGLVQAGVGRIVFREWYASPLGHHADPDALRMQEAVLSILQAAAVDVDATGTMAPPLPDDGASHPVIGDRAAMVAPGDDEPLWVEDEELSGPLLLTEYAHFLGFNLVVSGIHAGPLSHPPQRQASWAWGAYRPNERELACGFGLRDRAAARDAARAAAVAAARKAQ